MTVIRSSYSREGRLFSLAARLRSDADELERLGSDEPSYMPPPPLEPRHLSFRQKSMRSVRAIRAKQISLPAAGGWAAGITLAVEVLRIVLDHLSR